MTLPVPNSHMWLHLTTDSLVKLADRRVSRVFFFLDEPRRELHCHLPERWTELLSHHDFIGGSKSQNHDTIWDDNPKERFAIQRTLVSEIFLFYNELGCLEHSFFQFICRQVQSAEISDAE